jgi:hypothetical protein
MELRSVLFAAAFSAAAVTASPAFAADPLDCNSSLSLMPGATACAGFFDGNVLDNSPADVTTQTDALASLGLTFTNFNDYTKIDDLNGASVLNFGTTLFGDTIIGVHFGNGSGVGESTGFFEYDFTSPTNTIALNIPASSAAVLYLTGAVPEPATWALMLLGFAGIGLALRRRRALPGFVAPA